MRMSFLIEASNTLMVTGEFLHDFRMLTENIVKLFQGTVVVAEFVLISLQRVHRQHAGQILRP